MEPETVIRRATLKDRVEAGAASEDGPAVDAALVARLVAGQFPQWADLPVSEVAHGGWNNRMFRLGPDLVARLPRAAIYVAAVEAEQAWLPRLAPSLPLEVPAPRAVGRPADGYPWPWSIYGWLAGEPASAVGPGDELAFAVALAGFLAALHRIDSTGGPAPGPPNFFRGGPLAAYDGQARAAIARLGPGDEADRATAIWNRALASSWPGPPVWVHGDIAPANLLMRDGRLAGVIDFGQVCVGDPACDLGIAWTFLGAEARPLFRAILALDDETWARARGWVLWKQAILMTGLVGGHPRDVARARRLFDTVLADAL